ncbi:hypothetical protein O7632_27175 [Solwaraspora sp. WMMD406]|uniref:hypothetical protein n=1 Tax=Solwaraspora sp. WMMD406 TaxID=3016095 RepID=UPI0024164D46|nr:hypothetical protein [Solwaraspora sp. WMMD406]MDG4767748.1 hypothetical protein [Solwaraspora sp. WMMD406]
MEIYTIPELSTLRAACAPTVGGYRVTVAPTTVVSAGQPTEAHQVPAEPTTGTHQVRVQAGSTGAHQVQVAPTHQLRPTFAALRADVSVPSSAPAGQAPVTSAWQQRRRGMAVVAASAGNSSEGSLRTMIPTVKKPFLDAARGVPPRGRPV